MTRIWRFCFHLLYHRFAWTYDLVSRCVSLGHWRSWQRTVLPLLPPPAAGPILELAHGTGDLQIDLIGAGYHSFALDRSPNMGRLARRKLTGRGLRSQLLRAEAQALPFAADSFPAVVCTFPTAFILQPETLGELARILLPGGRAVLVLVGQLDGRGALPRFISLLYRLTGQSDQLEADAALRQRFRHPAFALETKIARLDGSAAQLLILTRTREQSTAVSELSLESAAES